jgi:uncharacterized protein YhhL (DUF1145 family)
MFWSYAMSFPIALFTAFKVTIHTVKIFGVFWRFIIIHLYHIWILKKRLKNRKKSEVEKLCSQTENYFFGRLTLRKIMVTKISNFQDLSGKIKNGHL